jgi:hypothetical protein
MMAMQTTRDAGAALTRLNDAAQGAGLAMVCTHESSEELHQSLVRQYLSSHPLKYLLAYATVFGLGRRAT